MGRGHASSHQRGSDGAISDYGFRDSGVRVWVGVRVRVRVWVRAWVGVGGGRVSAFGFRVQGSGFRVQGSGCRVQGSGFRVQDQGVGFRVHRSALVDGRDVQRWHQVRNLSTSPI